MFSDAECGSVRRLLQAGFYIFDHLWYDLYNQPRRQSGLLLGLLEGFTGFTTPGKGEATRKKENGEQVSKLDVAFGECLDSVSHEDVTGRPGNSSITFEWHIV